MCRLTLVAPLHKKVNPRLATALTSHFMAYNSSETGQDDGAGICIANKLTTQYHKSEKAGYAFVHADAWTDSLQAIEDSKLIDTNTNWLGHVRAATYGIKVNVQNSHPFIFDNITGMHNGFIRNKAEFTKDVESDSAAFFAYLARQVDNQPLTFDVLKEALDKVSGAFCMFINDRLNPDPSGVWIVVGKQRELWAMKNDHFFLVNTSKNGFAAVENLRQILKTMGNEWASLLEFPSDPVRLPVETVLFYGSGKITEIGKITETDIVPNTTNHTTGFQRVTTTVPIGTSAKLRECAKLWSTFIDQMEISIHEGNTLVEALLPNTTGKVWTSLTKDQLEYLVDFSNSLEELGYLKEIEVQMELWISILRDARNSCGLKWMDDPYKFLSRYFPDIQFPFWLNSVDELSNLSYVMTTQEGKGN